MPVTIVFSGKKGSGKSSCAKFCFAEYINKKIGKERFTVQKKGKESVLLDNFSNAIINTDFPNDELNQLVDCYKIKIYSFADPLKQICHEVFGLDMAQLYGSDDDKNSKTHLMWENFAQEIQDHYIRPKRGTGQKSPPTGFMTAREVLEVVGTHMFRKADETCWARALYSKIKKDNMDVAIVADCRFPNEVSMGTEMGAKVVRLLRNPYNAETAPEIALDNFPLAEYSAIVDNTNCSMPDVFKKLKKHTDLWLSNVR